MKIAFTDLECCVDCALYLANGDISEERPDIADDIKREWPNDNYHLVLDGGEDSEIECSWQSCDSCGSSLGGSRHKFSVLE